MVIEQDERGVTDSRKGTHREEDLIYFMIKRLYTTVYSTSVVRVRLEGDGESLAVLM